MRQSTKSSSSKRRSVSGRSTAGSAKRSSRTDEEDRYGALGTRMSSRDEYDMGRSDYGRGATYGSDYGRRGSSYGTGTSYGDNPRGNYGREGVRTISGRYSDFEDYSGSSRDREYRDDSERGFARGGRRGEYSSVNDQDFYEGNTGRSPWRDTYESERNNPSRGSSRSQNYSGQGRGYSEFDYDDDRINSRGSRYGSSHGYNEGGSDYEREARYGSSRDRDERWMNNYDNQDENVEDEYGYRGRYNENRY